MVPWAGSPDRRRFLTHRHASSVQTVCGGTTGGFYGALVRTGWHSVSGDKFGGKERKPVALISTIFKVPGAPRDPTDLPST